VKSVILMLRSTGIITLSNGSHSRQEFLSPLLSALPDAHEKTRWLRAGIGLNTPGCVNTPMSVPSIIESIARLVDAIETDGGI